MLSGDAPIRLALVEDQAFTRELTVERLQSHYGDDSAVVDGYSRVEDLLESGERYDVVLLDLQLRGGGIEGTAAIRALTHSGERVLVLSGVRSAEALEQTQVAGAWGFVSKDLAETVDVAAAIDDVLAGKNHVQAALLDDIGATERKRLTTRQQQVLRLEALGRTFGQIARGLDPALTEAGVKRHLEHIKEVYPECGKQADRVRLALALGLVSPWEVYQPPEHR